MLICWVFLLTFIKCAQVVAENVKDCLDNKIELLEVSTERRQMLLIFKVCMEVQQLKVDRRSLQVSFVDNIFQDFILELLFELFFQPDFALVSTIFLPLLSF